MYKIHFQVIDLLTFQNKMSNTRILFQEMKTYLNDQTLARNSQTSVK